MDKEEMRRVVREEHNIRDVETAPFAVLGSLIGATVQVSAYKWLFILTILESGIFFYLRDSGFWFVISLLALSLVLIFVPYLLAVIFPTGFIYLLLTHHFSSSAWAGNVPPTFSDYSAGFIETFWLWLAFLIISLLLVYRGKRMGE